MNVERVELIETLKCGKQIWYAGEILDSRENPIPAEILQEVKAGNGTVRVLEGSSAAMNATNPPKRQPIEV